ncbi:hypothetical protein M3Y97_01144000 [Aphelenchoides bicaudatus]|nr:hypothetical protein M3Y97_01144000 [Aphelenchoides bicaudatus]
MLDPHREDKLPLITEESQEDDPVEVANDQVPATSTHLNDLRRVIVQAPSTSNVSVNQPRSSSNTENAQIAIQTSPNSTEQIHPFSGAEVVQVTVQTPQEPDKDKQSKHLKNLISTSIALVALYFTAAGISIRAEALVHSNIVGACNDSVVNRQDILVIVFSVFAFGPSIFSFPLLIAAFGSFFYSLCRAFKLYTQSRRSEDTVHTQLCQREFFKDLIKEVLGITSATIVIGYLSGDPNADKDVHQACHGNNYEQAFKFIVFLNDILAILAIAASFLSLTIGFCIAFFWLIHECTKPKVRSENNSN